jgi:hypothetical protein
VRHDHDRPPAAVQPGEQLEHALLLAMVEPGRRLVEHEHVGPEREHRGDGEPLARALVEEERVLVARVEPDRRERLVDAPSTSSGASPRFVGPNATSSATVAAKS